MSDIRVWKTENGKQYWYNDFGKKMSNTFIIDENLNLYGVNEDGSMYLGVGKQTVPFGPNGTSITVYFNEDHTLDLTLAPYHDDFIKLVQSRQDKGTYTFVHQTDIHLDTWQNWLEKVDPENSATGLGPTMTANNMNNTNMDYYYNMSNLIGPQRQQVVSTIVKKLIKKGINPRMMAITGDNEDGRNSYKEGQKAALEQVHEIIQSPDLPTYVVQGNHDWNYYNVSLGNPKASPTRLSEAEQSDITVGDISKLPCTSCSFTPHYNKAHGYFSVKDEELKLYHIYLNNFDTASEGYDSNLWDVSAFTANQVLWLEEQLHQVPNDYRVFFWAHDGFPHRVADIPGYGGDMSWRMNYNPDTVASLIKAFQDSADYNITSNARNAQGEPQFGVSIKGSFKGSPTNRAISWFYGHVHHDQFLSYNSASNGLSTNIISEWNQSKDWWRSGTPAGNIFAVITVDPDKHKFYYDEFGGTSRVVDFPLVGGAVDNHDGEVGVIPVDENGTQIEDTIWIKGDKDAELSLPSTTGAGHYNLKKGSSYTVKGVSNETTTITYIPDDDNPLATINAHKYLSVGFNQFTDDSTSTFKARMRAWVSNDGKKWEILATNYPNEQSRGAGVLKYQDTWYIIDTNGFHSTTDFKTFKTLPDPLAYGGEAHGVDNSIHKNIYAPEFIKDVHTGQYHIVYSGDQPANAVREGGDDKHVLYLADFDPDTGVISNYNQVLIGNLGSDLIDPNITYDPKTSYYYLWASLEEHNYDSTYLWNRTNKLRLYRSYDLIGPWELVSINGGVINYNSQQIKYEAPEMILDPETGGYLLYADPYGDYDGTYAPIGVDEGHDGIMYLTLDSNLSPTMDKWTLVESDTHMRHMSIIETNPATTSTSTTTTTTRKEDPIVSTPYEFILNNNKTITLGAREAVTDGLGIARDNLKLVANRQYRIKATYTSVNYRSQTFSLQWYGGDGSINNTVNYPINSDGLQHNIVLDTTPKANITLSAYIGIRDIAFVTINSFDVIDVATGASIMRDKNKEANLVEEYKNNSLRLWYPTGDTSKLTISDNSGIPVDPNYPEFNKNDPVIDDINKWTKHYLEDSDLVYGAKDMLNAINSLLPLLGKQALRYSEAPIDERVNWLDLSGNRLYEFVNVGDNGPDTDQLLAHTGLVFVSKTPSNNNMAYLVVTPVSLAFKFGGTGKGDWFYFTTADGQADSVFSQIMDILEKNYVTKDELPDIPDVSKFVMKTDFQLLQNQVTSQEVRVGNLENNKVIGRNYFVMRNLSDGLWGGDSVIYPGNYQHTPMINIPINQKNLTITFYTKQPNYGGTGILFNNVNGAALKYYNIGELAYVDVTDRGTDAVESVTIPIPEGSATVGFFISKDIDSTNLKLEFGDTFTSYTVAPEDVVTRKDLTELAKVSDLDRYAPRRNYAIRTAKELVAFPRGDKNAYLINVPVSEDYFGQDIMVHFDWEVNNLTSTGGSISVKSSNLDGSLADIGDSSGASAITNLDATKATSYKGHYFGHRVINPKADNAAYNSYSYVSIRFDGISGDFRILPETFKVEEYGNSFETPWCSAIEDGYKKYQPYDYLDDLHYYGVSEIPSNYYDNYGNNPIATSTYDSNWIHDGIITNTDNATPATTDVSSGNPAYRVTSTGSHGFLEFAGSFLTTKTSDKYAKGDIIFSLPSLGFTGDGYHYILAMCVVNSIWKPIQLQVWGHNIIWGDNHFDGVMPVGTRVNISTRLGINLGI